MKSEHDPIKEMVLRFEHMKKSDSISFFEEEELEDIIDHYIKARHYKKAFDALEIARSQHPFSVLFVVMKAQVHMQLCENQIALDLLNQAELIEPQFGEIHFTRGSIYSQMGLPEKAIECFKQAAS